VPRSGGQATTAGVSFQQLAVARAIIEVYQGVADFVRPEPPPYADLGQQELVHVTDGAGDYVVRQNGRLIYHQAKSNAPGGGSWTVSRLHHEGVLRAFFNQLRYDSTAECRLVTPSPCPLFAEIAEQAEHSVSHEEFTANLSGEHRGFLAEVSAILAIDPPAARTFLRRCRFEGWTDNTLRNYLQMAGCLFADPESAINCLICLAGEAMKQGRQIDGAAVHSHLRKQGIFARPVSTEEQLLQSVAAAGARMRSVAVDIAGVHVLQPAVDQLFQWTVGNSSRTSHIAALLDQAGSGKTASLAVLMHRLERAGHTVLAVKVDGLSFSSQQELAEALGLPDPIPSVVQRLAASGHRMVVLIDQVDALSSAMSRQPAAINVILDLVSQLAGLRQVPLVIACRSSDWRYDHRIRALHDYSPQEFPLPELTDAQLDAVLSAHSLSREDLRPPTIEIARRPLHLAMLVKIINTHRQYARNWSPAQQAIYTLQSLYQEFWRLEMGKADEPDGPGSHACENVIADMAQRMHNTQQFAVPEGAAAAQQRAATWLCSEGIIERLGQTLTFFHQTFFDFVFARHFVSNGQSLVEHLLSQDQGLFFRPMVRQVLEYLRSVDRVSYLRTVRGMLEHKRIRRHLRWLTVRWLGQLPEPWQQELELLHSLLADVPTRQRVFVCLWGNAAWFDLITASRISNWMRADDTAACRYAISVLPKRQSQVVALLAPYLGKSAAWHQMIGYGLSTLEAGWQDCSVHLFLNLLRHPLTDLDDDGAWWASALEHLAKDRPGHACDAVKVALERFLPRWHEAHPRKGRKDWSPHAERSDLTLFPRTGGFEEVLHALSRVAPTALLDAVSPWLLECLDLTCGANRRWFFRYHWRYWDYDRKAHPRGTNAMMVAVADSCRQLAHQDPSSLRALLAKMLTLDVLPLQTIAAEAYMENPAEFASDAADFLCGDKRRFWLGVPGQSVWISTKLLTACCPYWPDSDMQRVEAAILALSRARPSATSDQIEFLWPLDPRRLSPKGQRKLRSLRRQYPDFRPMPPPSFEMVRAGPPLPEEELAKLDDEGWLQIMKDTVSEWGEPGLPPKRSGGRIELCRSLREHAKRAPQRFCRLALDRLNQHYHPDYAAAIISGCAESGLPVEDLERLVTTSTSAYASPNIREMASAMGKYGGSQVPESLVALLTDWALHATDPSASPAEADANVSEDQLGGGKPDWGNLVDEGINSDRGDALWALAAIFLKAVPPRRAEYLDLVERVADDPSAAVRAVALQFLSHALQGDPPRACSLFQRLVGQDLRLLREKGAYDFVYYSLHSHVNHTRWAIKSMLNDQEDPKARQSGARLACLAEFRDGPSRGLWDQCLSGDIAMRKGAAEVCATNLMDEEIGGECQQHLRLLMNDDSPEVREAVASLFHHLDELGLQCQAGFLREWSRSESVMEGADDAARLLEQYPMADPLLTLDLAQRFIEAIGSPMTDFRTRHGSVSFHLVPAILNVYHQSLDQAIRNRAMDLFEQLEDLGCPDVGRAIEAVDRL
jgi:hypothetical protein